MAAKQKKCPDCNGTGQVTGTPAANGLALDGSDDKEGHAMAFIVKISDPDGTPWISETGDSKEQVIRKLQERAGECKFVDTRARIEDAIRRLRAS